MSIAFSRAKSLVICRSSRQPNSSLSSISRPPRPDRMKRREFISLLGSAAVAWPLAARSQQQTMPVIGLLSGSSLVGRTHMLTAFLRGLRESGYVEGENVAIEYRWGQDQYDRLPDLAANRVGCWVAMIPAIDTAATIAAYAASATV